MILHIDMDAFYASVEQADNPKLKGQCVIIGGSGNRSVVSAASYEARRYGVRSAMPMFMARQKCPEGIILPVRMDRYKDISTRIMAVFRRYSPMMEQVSIDEAFMDVTGSGSLLGKPEEIAAKIKQDIKKTFDLTCSVGVASSKFLAKIASDVDKPDGLTVILPEEVHRFIATLPIGKVPGVGAKAMERLANMGIKYLGDINELSHEMIIKKMGKYGHRLIDLARGIDRSSVSPDGSSKSVGSEETLSDDTSDRQLLKTCLLKHAEDVGHHLRRKKVKAKTITLKIKLQDFTQITRSTTLKNPTQSTKAIFEAAVNLFEKYHLRNKIRLIGVSAASLLPEEMPVQLSIFNETDAKDKNWEKVDEVMDEITRKFGRSVIQKANLADDQPRRFSKKAKKMKKIAKVKLSPHKLS